MQLRTREENKKQKRKVTSTELKKSTKFSKEFSKQSDHVNIIKRTDKTCLTQKIGQPPFPNPLSLESLLSVEHLAFTPWKLQCT